VIGELLTSDETTEAEEIDGVDSIATPKKTPVHRSLAS
jgi:hypothetical protein